MSAPQRESAAQFAAKNFTRHVIFLLNHHVTESTLYDDRMVDQNKQFALLKFPPSTRLPCIDTIYCQEKKMMRIIRVTPGETSIYADEQTRYKDTPIKEIPIHSVEFGRTGELRVGHNETLLLKFLRIANFNATKKKNKETGAIEFVVKDRIDKPTTYIEVDHSSAFEGIMEDEMLVHDRKHFCYKGNYEEVLGLAHAIGMSGIEYLDEVAVRFTLAQYADRNPNLFDKARISPIMKRKHWLREAVKANVLTINGLVISFTGGKPITSAPIGKDPIDHLAELIVETGQEGELLYNKIKEFTMTVQSPDFANVGNGLNLDAIPKQTETVKNVVNNDKVKMEKSINKPASEMEFEEFLYWCKKQLLIQQKGPWYYLTPSTPPKEGEKEEPAWSGNNKEKMRLWFKTDPAGQALREHYCMVIDSAKEPKAEVTV